jgi:Domain of unknown function (DUF309)
VARSHRKLRQPAPHRGPDLTKEPTAPDPIERADGATSEEDTRNAERAGSTSRIAQGDRLKAYRPIPPDLRRTALDAGLAAYERGDYFKAHELLEPAWMGTSDLGERALYQGLIKLAAGYVHAVRGNPIGVARNLSGARAHLATAQKMNPEIARAAGIDLTALLARVDDRLAEIAALAEEPASARTPLIDVLPEAPQVR